MALLTASWGCIMRCAAVAARKLHTVDHLMNLSTTAVITELKAVTRG